jgi:Domain of unknown function (DUF4166)
MRPQEVTRNIAKTADATPELGDLRFRALLPEAEWAELPAAIRHRFSKRLAGGKTIIYVGEVEETRISRAGWPLVQAARLIGGPLPTRRDAHVPSVVTVTEDVASGGQIWTRLYARKAGFPQVIHSSKRFCGPTGLEEYIGRGVGMALTIQVDDHALIFRSHHFFLQLFGTRIRLPRWLTPGALSVTHKEIGSGAFSFTLDVAHPRFGSLVYQFAVFREVSS